MTCSMVKKKADKFILPGVAIANIVIMIAHIFINFRVVLSFLLSIAF